MTYRMNAEHVAELAIISKHFNALYKELDEHRKKNEWTWGDGFFLSIDKVKIETDAEETVGVMAQDGFGFSFSQEKDA